METSINKIKSKFSNHSQNYISVDNKENQDFLNLPKIKLNYGLNKKFHKKHSFKMVRNIKGDNQQIQEFDEKLLFGDIKNNYENVISYRRKTSIIFDDFPKEKFKLVREREMTPVIESGKNPNFDNIEEINLAEYESIKTCTNKHNSNDLKSPKKKEALSGDELTNINSYSAEKSSVNKNPNLHTNKNFINTMEKGIHIKTDDSCSIKLSPDCKLFLFSLIKINK